MKRRRVRGGISQGIVIAVIVLLLFLMLYPLAMTLWGSFKNEFNYETTKLYPTLPLRVTNLSAAFPHIWRYIVNTVLVAACSVTGTLFISSISAYTFARMQFVGKKALYTLVIAFMMIPGVLTLVPSYMLYDQLIGLDNYLVLIIPSIVGSCIFGIFLLRGFFEGLPEAVFEAARIDGAREFQVYAKVCLPMSMPIMGTLAIMQIVNIWNDYMWPMITIQSDSLLTISAGLFLRFSTLTNINYPILFSGYVLASLPLVLLFVFANKYYVEGLTSSAIKM